MEIDDLAVAGLPDAHIVHLAHAGDFGGERCQRLPNLTDASG